MELQPIRYEHVLAATDFSEMGNRSVAYAILVASSQEQATRLSLLHVMSEPGADATQDLIEELRASTSQRLRDFVPADIQRQVELSTAVHFGEPAEEILNYAQLEKVDLIAMGTHGRTGVARLLIGSVAERVLRGSEVDVTIIRG